MYTKGSSSYHQWLRTGQFDARYAPTAATRAAVVSYLKSEGLTVTKSASPFLVRAVGSKPAGEHRLPHHAEQLPRPARRPVLLQLHRRQAARRGRGEVTRRHRAHQFGARALDGPSDRQRHPPGRRKPAAKGSSPPACETPYPTEQQIANALLGISGFPFGYGGGPGCNGLTPQQVNSIYSAPHAGPRGKGAGVNTAVFELSAYQHSDIDTWAHTFYGSSFNPPLVDVNVDGGPLHPVCPAGDQCPPSFNGYAGDIEVDADIEMQLTISPDMRHLIVYNAPNDFTGQTELDEYTAIANANTADSVSSSWAVCEQDVTASYAQAENVVFEQMAAQGQSMFGAEGDTGAFSCIRSDGTTGLAVLDPPSQPWVTSVGGTSFENFNPGASTEPVLPDGPGDGLELPEPVQRHGQQRGRADRLRLVRWQRRGRRRQQPVLGPAVLPARSRR